MEFHILTLFPDLAAQYFNESILGRAQKKGLVRIFCHQLRDYASDKHHTVDDRPYGGGAGMIIKPDVLVKAVSDLKQKYAFDKVVLLSPRGSLFSHEKAKAFSKLKSMLLICGRYEGVDQRAIDAVVDSEISVGDYVISGGELAAQVIVDATARLIPGVVGDERGPLEESHAHGLLEHPQYTRPVEFRGLKVPDVLLSGNHVEIEKWKREESVKITLKNRPDLPTPSVCEAFSAASSDSLADRIYIALLHHPVRNKHGEVVTTSITNFDLHDLARTTASYGLKKFFVVTPNKAQQGMAEYIRRYWQEGPGSQYNPDRKEAFKGLEITDNLDETCLTIKNIHGISPRLVATTARDTEKAINFNELKLRLEKIVEPCLVLFGTGWGLADEVLNKACWVLSPIRGPSAYNHLPVRSAVAVVLDRLLGR